MMKIRTSKEIRAGISFNKGYEHLSNDPKEKWVALDDVEELLEFKRQFPDEWSRFVNSKLKGD